MAFGDIRAAAASDSIETTVTVLRWRRRLLAAVWLVRRHFSDGKMSECSVLRKDLGLGLALASRGPGTRLLHELGAQLFSGKENMEALEERVLKQVQ